MTNNDSSHPFEVHANLANEKGTFARAHSLEFQGAGEIRISGDNSKLVEGNVVCSSKAVRVNPGVKSMFQCPAEVKNGCILYVCGSENEPATINYPISVDGKSETGKSSRLHLPAINFGNTQTMTYINADVTITNGGIFPHRTRAQASS